MPTFRDDDPTLARLELQALPAGAPAGEVASQLIGLLTKGDFSPGSRLPPERHLAEELGVGRSAVREALAALEILGLVAIRPGSGTYLRGNASELLPTTLSWGLMLSGDRTRELIELRAGLEVMAAAAAAERISSTELDELSGYLEIMETSTDDVEAFVEADLRFHLTIAIAADNTVLRDLLQTVRSLLRLWAERALHDSRQAREAAAEHREVYEALVTRDPAAVRAAMQGHMETASQRLSSVT